MKQVLFLLLLLSTSAPTMASSKLATQQQFNAAYTSYEAQVDKGNWQAALKYALQSYKLAPQLYDESHPYRIALARNLGLVYTKLRQEDATKYLSEALTLAEGVHGKNSPKLIEHLVDLATAHIRYHRRGREGKYFKRALKLSKQEYGEYSAEYGNLNSKIGNIITQKAGTKAGRRYLDKSIEVLEQAVGKDSVEYGVAALLKGKYELSSNDYKSAVTLFNETLAAFEKEDQATGQIELTTHAFLVEAYQKLDQPDLATQHCLAIGQMTPVRDKQNFTPVFRKLPSYPKSAAEKGLEGWVDFAFSVDKSGFIQNPRMINSKGHSSFEKSALEALEGFRYAPSFENGEPVVTDDVEVRIAFKMAR